MFWACRKCYKEAEANDLEDTKEEFTQEQVKELKRRKKAMDEGAGIPLKDLEDTKQVKTMHETYGEPNDKIGKHFTCDKCGYCITCGDCKKYGCTKDTKNEASKISSTLSKDINRLREKCNNYRNMNDDRKYLITQYDKFIKKLIKEDRITKEEIGIFIKKRKENPKYQEDLDLELELETLAILHDKDAMEAINAHKARKGDYSDYIPLSDLEDTLGEPYDKKLFCSKCKTNQTMTKNRHGKRPEDFSWYCPKCDDLISQTAVKNAEDRQHAPGGKE